MIGVAIAVGESPFANSRCSSKSRRGAVGISVSIRMAVD